MLRMKFERLREGLHPGGLNQARKLHMPRSRVVELRVENLCYFNFEVPK